MAGEAEMLAPLGGMSMAKVTSEEQVTAECAEEASSEAAPSNFERLAMVLPETGLARGILAAWMNGDPSSRAARMLGVVQPTNSSKSDKDDAPQD